jgi:hypothetical protein
VLAKTPRLVIDLLKMKGGLPLKLGKIEDARAVYSQAERYSNYAWLDVGQHQRARHEALAGCDALKKTSRQFARMHLANSCFNPVAAPRTEGATSVLPPSPQRS